MYHCKKQIVVAIIITCDNKVYVGYNDCENNIEVCPRTGMDTGEGYDLCKTICKQNSHAEISAINKCEDKFELKDATLILKGHSYICDNCKSELRKVGIEDWTII
jgi:deoxycytidylate deaminase